MIVSPAALGAMLLIFFNNPLGIWIQKNYAQFVFTAYGIILAQFVTIVGIATRFVKAAMDEISGRYEDVARSLGASPLRAFFTTTLPLSKNGIIAASALTWAKAIGEFGATITIGGSMAMKTETLPVAIFMRLSKAGFRSEEIIIICPNHEEMGGRENVIQGQLLDIFNKGSYYMLLFKPVNAVRIIEIQISGYEFRKLCIEKGQDICILLEPERVFLLSN